MNERDKLIVETAKAHGGTMGTKGRDLLELIDRLDKQLTNLVKEGEPFQRSYNDHLLHLKGQYTDAYESAETQSRFMSLHQLGLGLANFSRLAQVLKEVKDE